MIYYFIFNGPFNSGVGGHYNSLRVIAGAIAEHRTVKVIVLGDRDTDLFRKSGLDSVFFQTSWLSQIKVISQLVDMIREEDVEDSVLHAFDGNALFFARIIGTILGLQCCFTKCGGPKSLFLSKTRDIVLFSGEDADYYWTRRSYRNCTFHLIPNRIAVPTLNEERLRVVSREVEFHGVKLLRITRVGHYYRKTMGDAVRLLCEMQRNGIPARLYIIGKVTEPEVYEEFSGIDGVEFLTDERYYRQASELIPIFDVVIGTGRSAMEGLSYGKPVLAPARNTALPRLVTDATIDAFRYYNFSERTILSEAVVCTRDDYHALVNNPEPYRAQSEHYFREHFFVGGGVDAYFDKVYVPKKRSYYPINFVLRAAMTQAKFALDVIRQLAGRRQHAFKRFVDTLVIAR